MASPGELSSFGARLRWLRRAKGMTQVELARRVGRHQTVIGPYERDEYMPARETVERLARVLETSPEYLLFGRDAERPRVPIMGRVGEGGLLLSGPPEGRESLRLRYEVLLAYRVEGDAMIPVYPPGSILLAARGEAADAAELLGRDALVELEDGRVLLRRLLPAARPDRFDLGAYNAPVLREARVARAWAVLGQLRQEAFLGEG